MMFTLKPRHSFVSVASEIAHGLNNNTIVLSASNVDELSYQLHTRDFMAMLLIDLNRCEKNGLSLEISLQVLELLEKLTNSMSSIPAAHFYKKPVYKEMQEFKDLFRRWSGISGEGKEAITLRRNYYTRLQHQRKRVVDRLRENQKVLSKELDAELVKQGYSLAASLVARFPVTFKGIELGLREISPNNEFQPTSFVGG